MKRSRFTEEQIIGILREQEAGVTTAEGSLTLKVLHFEGCKPLVEKAFYETAIV